MALPQCCQAIMEYRTEDGGDILLPLSQVASHSLQFSWLNLLESLTRVPSPQLPALPRSDFLSDSSRQCNGEARRSCPNLIRTNPEEGRDFVRSKVARSKIPSPIIVEQMQFLFDHRAACGKLRGLRQLPKLWAPPFFAIPSELHDRWVRIRKDARSDTLDLIEPAERNWIQSEVRRFGDQPQAMSLIVRSNGRGEGLEQRGLLRSVRCDGTVEAILAATVQAFEDSFDAGAPNPISLIVEVHCSPTLKGHFSNERRVSEARRRWLCEMDSTSLLGQESLPRLFNCRVEKAQPSVDRQLLCTDRRELIDNLRSVGKYFYERRERRHLEWVWDGGRLWIVQIDHAPDAVGESPEWTPVVATEPVNAGKLTQFRIFSTADAKHWQKLKCVETFRCLELPTTSLFVLHGGRKISQLARKGTLGGLASDLTELTKGPLVIRTDIAGQTVLFANRTDCLSKPQPAIRFMQNTARDLLKAGIDAKQVCFIAHRFIPAYASAFSMATAKRILSIDALWGLPDGLEYCSHDSFEVKTSTGEIIARKIR